MGCCKCEEHKWDDPQPTQYMDGAGKRYCLFHAPKDEKKMTAENFNTQIFTSIYNTTRNNNTVQKKNCDLTGVIFSGDISFAAFNYDNPLPSVYFSNCTFCGRVDFDEAAFGGITKFANTEFLEHVDFDRAQFTNETDFDTAKFMAQATFEQTRFLSDVNFYNAEFKCDVVFSQATFGGAGTFARTTFFGKADFWLAVFGGRTLFFGATFGREANFQRASFADATNFVGIRASVNAVRLHSLSPASLSNIYFSSMETDNLSFKGCEWPEKLGCESKAHFITDLEETPSSAARICEEAYRSLKLKAASEHDQPMTSWWHYREKLMKLEGIKSRYPYKWHIHWLGLYWRLCGFGERWVPPLKALGWMLLFCLFLLGLFGVQNDTAYNIQGPANIGTWTGSWEGTQNLGSVCLSLLKYLLLIKEESIEFKPIHGAAEFLILLFTRLVIPIQAAFFAIALRNAYRR